MDRRNWEQRNTDITLYETNQELESQRLGLYQATQWADQTQRKKDQFLWKTDQNLSRKSSKRLKNLRSYEELVAKKQIEPDN